MRRWNWKSTFGVAVLAAAFAFPAFSQEDEEEAAECVESCYEGEERCFAICDDADDIDACEVTCEEAVDHCLEHCE
jgi:hypothetical protein